LIFKGCTKFGAQQRNFFPEKISVFHASNWRPP
jgi:hypothetical protein